MLSLPYLVCKGLLAYDDRRRRKRVCLCAFKHMQFLFNYIFCLLSFDPQMAFILSLFINSSSFNISSPQQQVNNGRVKAYSSPYTHVSLPDSHLTMMTISFQRLSLFHHPSLVLPQKVSPDYWNLGISSTYKISDCVMMQSEFVAA